MRFGHISLTKKCIYSYFYCTNKVAERAATAFERDSRMRYFKYKLSKD